jgi:hypothetical protein
MAEIKINTRSPIYKKYQQYQLQKVVLDIYVYSGTKTTDRGTRKIRVEKIPTGTNDYVIFEVSEIIREYLEPTLDLPLDSNKGYIKWVELEATIT